MRVLTVVGARPQFIKASVVSAELQTRQAEELLLHTGQHFDEEMSAVFFDELEIRPPDLELGIHSSTHAVMTGKMMIGIEEALLTLRPDAVIVYGDTNSTLAGALAAAKLRMPVAHVEAGLRSFNRAMPEEVNRVVTDHVSDLLLAPTATACSHLQNEGIPNERVAQVGDVMFDVALRFARIAAQGSDGAPERLGVAGSPFVLATVHRAENTDDPARLRAILDGLADVGSDMPVVLPLHPRTREIVGHQIPDAIRVVPPLGYLEMSQMEMAAEVVCTDSGGVQKEAFFHRVPCVTLRDETEWVELVELGWNHLVSPTSAAAVAAGVRAARLAGPGVDASPYGDGRAAVRIVDELLERYGR